MTEVSAQAPPNDLAPEQLRLRPGADGVSVELDPASAGWRHLSFRITQLAEGERLALVGDGREHLVVTISGGGASVLPSNGPLVRLDGRPSPFEALPWACYLPAGIGAILVGHPAAGSHASILAIADAPSSGRETADLPVRIAPADVRVEVRGAGTATRQVNHIVAPEFPADRLLVVEVLTPGGNWSSWPPHKHDRDDMPNEAVLEEVYYYRMRRPEGWALQRLYRPDGSRDTIWAVRDGEVVLVTDGYHPFAAAHGYDAYYLNALAGDRRTMACSDDPDLAWTRAAWARLAPDRRVPLVPPTSPGSASASSASPDSASAPSPVDGRDASGARGS